MAFQIIGNSSVQQLVQGIAGDLRRHNAWCDVIVMLIIQRR